MAPVATALSPPETPIKDIKKGGEGMGRTHDESKLKAKAQATTFCERIYKSAANVKLPKRENKVRVTLTYAQSSDGKISGPSKRMVALSGSESMIMTHTLRRMHDAILIGIGTLVNDNPQLNTRLILPILSTKIEDLPRPIILDSGLKTPLDCKLLTNARNGMGRWPLIISSINNAFEGKAELLRKAGAQIEYIDLHEGQLPWQGILYVLDREGHRSVMIEGGANVIESLFKADGKEDIIDELIVTVAPISLGEDATGYSKPNWLSQKLHLSQDKSCTVESELDLVDSTPEAFGKDDVYVWTRRGPRK